MIPNSSKYPGHHTYNINQPAWSSNLNNREQITLATNDPKSHLNIYLRSGMDENFGALSGRTHSSVCIDPTTARELRDALNVMYPVIAGVAAPKTFQSPARKAPKGPQAYKGNGKHEWEPVTSVTNRLRVPGGWLYETGDSAPCFVPVPDVTGYSI
jgi:hypothetical protein